jgi:hypothetical protein
MGDIEETDEVEVVPKATLDQLKKKTRVSKTVQVGILGDDGQQTKVEMVFQAISAAEFDLLKSRYKPTQDQKKMGLDYNVDKFAPVLLAKTCIEPAMTEEDANDIWESDNWNRGERMQLLMAALEVCTKGLDIPFISSG